MKYEKRNRKNKSKHVDNNKELFKIIGLRKNQSGTEQFKDLNIRKKS